MQPVTATVGMRRRLRAATLRRPYFAGAPARRDKIKGNIMSAVTLRATRRGPLRAHVCLLSRWPPRRRPRSQKANYVNCAPDHAIRAPLRTQR